MTVLNNKENRYALEHSEEYRLKLLAVLGKTADEESHWKAEHMSFGHAPRLDYRPGEGIIKELSRIRLLEENTDQGAEKCEKK